MPRAEQRLASIRRVREGEVSPEAGLLRGGRVRKPCFGTCKVLPKDLLAFGCALAVLIEGVPEVMQDDQQRLRSAGTVRASFRISKVSMGR